MTRVRITIEVSFNSESEQRLLDMLLAPGRVPWDWFLHPENGPLHSGGGADFSTFMYCDAIREKNPDGT